MDDSQFSLQKKPEAIARNLGLAGVIAGAVVASTLTGNVIHKTTHDWEVDSKEVAPSYSAFASSSRRYESNQAPEFEPTKNPELREVQHQISKAFYAHVGCFGVASNPRNAIVIGANALATLETIVKRYNTDECNPRYIDTFMSLYRILGNCFVALGMDTQARACASNQLILSVGRKALYPSLIEGGGLVSQTQISKYLQLTSSLLAEYKAAKHPKTTLFDYDLAYFDLTIRGLPRCIDCNTSLVLTSERKHSKHSAKTKTVIRNKCFPPIVRDGVGVESQNMQYAKCDRYDPCGVWSNAKKANERSAQHSLKSPRSEVIEFYIGNPDGSVDKCPQL